MKTRLAPGTTWEVRLRWGSRRLTAALLGLDRRTLALGNARGDDFDTGSSARLHFSLAADGALELTFSTGVGGLVRLGGGAPTPLGQLTERTLAKEVSLQGAPSAYQVRLQQGHSAALKVGALTVDVRRADGRLQRVRFDARVLLLVVLALVAIGIILASLSAPHPGPNPKWVAPKRR